MSLRSLFFEIGFDADPGGIQEMDSAMSEFKDTTMDLQDEMGGLTNATEEMARRSQDSMRQLRDSFTGMAIGAIAVGGGIEMMAREQAALTQTTQQMAHTMGITEGAVRDLALSTANVTLPINEVLDLFTIARQRGAETSEELQDFALFWDMVGDATGGSSVALAHASIGLNALGLELSDQSEALAAFGFIHTETTSNIGEFLDFLSRTGPQLREMGMDIEDAAAMLGILEKEMGLSGRYARTEFRRAVNEADGSLEAMFETLGVSADALTQYRGNVERSSGVIEDFADIHGESYTRMQELQFQISALTYEHGELIQTASDLSPILIAIGTGFLVVGKIIAAFNPMMLLAAATVGAVYMQIKRFMEGVEEIVKIFNYLRDTVSDRGWEGVGRDMMTFLGRGIASGIGNVQTLLSSILPGNLMPSLAGIGGGGSPSFSAPPVSRNPVRSMTQTSNTTFAPSVSVNVGAGAGSRETAREMERTFDRMLSDYSRKIATRNPLTTLR